MMLLTGYAVEKLKMLSCPTCFIQKKNDTAQTGSRVNDFNNFYAKAQHKSNEMYITQVYAVSYTHLDVYKRQVLKFHSFNIMMSVIKTSEHVQCV